MTKCYYCCEVNACVQVEYFAQIQKIFLRKVDFPFMLLPSHFFVSAVIHQADAL